MYHLSALSALALLHIPFASASILQRQTQSACVQTCNELSKTLGEGAVSTIQPVGFYWAQQQSEVKAACYVSPTCAQDVSTILLKAKKYKCKLAIRGGGHSDVPGASNIQDGLVISLGKMNTITYDSSQSVTRVGPGNRWGDVYKALDPFNVTVVGGREESVGVAGLLLGGGLSFFSGTRGYACDGVRSFEAVLADGKIVEVTGNSQYKDLFKALKGGGNNFAVVTRFDLDTFPYQGIYGGLAFYNDSPQVRKEIVDGFIYFVNNAPTAPNGAMFIATSLLPTGFIWSAGLAYTLPDSNPAIFQPFKSTNLTSAQLINTNRITTHGDLATELGKTQLPGLRNQFATATTRVTAGLVQTMVDIFRDEAKKAQPQILVPLGFVPTISFQPLTKNILTQQSRNGGNVLGTEASEGPLVIVNFLWQWSSTLDDKVVLQGIQNVVDRCTEAARQRGLLNEFVYQNYAAPKQQPIATYGMANRDFLRQVSYKYDPTGVFQKLVAGGFKLK